MIYLYVYIFEVIIIALVIMAYAIIFIIRRNICDNCLNLYLY